MLVHWFLRCWCSLLTCPPWLCPVYLDFPNSCGILFLTASYFTFISRHIHSWLSFPLWPSCFILSGAISNCPPLFPISVLEHLQTWRAHILVSDFLALSYCSWGSRGKNIKVVCHSLLHWTMFCQNSPLWPVCLRWPCMAWLIASLSYTSPFAMTRLWSTKGLINLSITNQIKTKLSTNRSHK